MPTWLIAPSVTCSCKLKSCPSARLSCARGGRAHRGNRCRGCFICWRRRKRLPTSRRTKQIAPALSDAAEPRPTHWCWMMLTARRRCRTRMARCSTPLSRSAAASVCLPMNQRRYRSSPVSRTRVRRHWRCSTGIVTGTLLSALLKWHGSRARKCCVTSTPAKPMHRSMAASPAP